MLLAKAPRRIPPLPSRWRWSQRDLAGPVPGRVGAAGGAATAWGAGSGSRPAHPPLPRAPRRGEGWFYRGAEMPGMPHGSHLPDSCLSAQPAQQSEASCCICILHVLNPRPAAPEHSTAALGSLGSDPLRPSCPWWEGVWVSMLLIPPVGVPRPEYHPGPLQLGL